MCRVTFQTLALSSPSHPEDFHAYCEVYLGGRWFTFDARFNAPRVGRIKLSHGLDAVLRRANASPAIV